MPPRRPQEATLKLAAAFSHVLLHHTCDHRVSQPIPADSVPLQAFRMVERAARARELSGDGERKRANVSRSFQHSHLAWNTSRR
jgi:hypothetical protein